MTAKPEATAATGATGAASPMNPAAQVRLRAEYGKLPLAFEANQGQTDAQVEFLSRGAGYTLFLTGGGAVLDLKKSEARSQKSGGSGQLSVVSGQSSVGGGQLKRNIGLGAEGNGPRTTDNGQMTKDSILSMCLIGSNPGVPAVGEDELPGKSNYFIGNDPKKWRTNVANYAKVRYQNVYPGIDLVYYGNQGRLEYDFVVAPGADPNAIELDVAAGLSRHEKSGGVKPPLRVDRNGDLIVKMDGGEVRFNKPVVYQMASDERSRTPNPESRTPIKGRYRLRHHQVTFEVAKYDRTRPLVIDPAVTYATFLGGSSDNSASAIAVDSSGNAYVTGWTASADFPVTGGAFQTVYAGDNSEPYQNSDAFVSKLNSTGTALAYSTYLGGSGGDSATGVAVDSSGNAFITGATNAIDFPTTTGAFQTKCGDCDPFGNGEGAFVAALNATGSSLIYSTYLSGDTWESSAGIALDSADSAYVTGLTASADFPTSTGAFQSCAMSTGWVYAAKINATGSALIYSTCLQATVGGGPFPSGPAIAVDTSGEAYVAGATCCYSDSPFPTTPGAFQTTLPGYTSAFVTKFNATGTGLVYSTFVGGSGSGSGEGGATSVAVDGAGDAYLTGYTNSPDFPTTPGAFKTSCDLCGSGGFQDLSAFVTELNPAGSGLVYSTFVGGVGTNGTGIALDSSGDAWIVGGAMSLNFPTTAGAFDGSISAGPTFVAELNPTGTSLPYSSYFPVAGANGVAADNAGNVYITGIASSSMTATTSAFQTTCPATGESNYCAFVAKLVPGDQVWPLGLDFGNQNVGTTAGSQTTTLTNSESTALTISGLSITGASDFTQTNSCGPSLAAGASCTVTITFTPSVAGSRSATLNITDSAENSPQTVTLTGTGVGVPTTSVSPAASPAHSPSATTPRAATRPWRFPAPAWISRWCRPAREQASRKAGRWVTACLWCRRADSKDRCRSRAAVRPRNPPAP